MKPSHMPPPGANSTRPNSLPPTSFDWANPTLVRAWLTAIRDTGDDLAALSREGTRRVRRRFLSRHERRRRTREAEASLRSLVTAAEAALPTPGT